MTMEQSLILDTLCGGDSGLFNHKFDYRAQQPPNIYPLVSDSLLVIDVFNHRARLFLLDTGSKKVKPFRHVCNCLIIVLVMIHAFEWPRLCVISLCFHGNRTIRVLLVLKHSSSQVLKLKPFFSACKLLFYVPLNYCCDCVVDYNLGTRDNTNKNPC